MAAHHVQYGTGVLRQVSQNGRSQEPETGHHEEWPLGHQGYVSGDRLHRLPYRIALILLPLFSTDDGAMRAAVWRRAQDAATLVVAKLFCLQFFWGGIDHFGCQSGGAF